MFDVPFYFNPICFLKILRNKMQKSFGFSIMTLFNIWAQKLYKTQVTINVFNRWAFEKCYPKELEQWHQLQLWRQDFHPRLTFPGINPNGFSLPYHSLLLLLLLQHRKQESWFSTRSLVAVYAMASKRNSTPPSYFPAQTHSTTSIYR